MKEKILKIIAEGLGLGLSEVTIEAQKENIPQWDSVAQLGIATALEDEFDFVLEPEDIMNCVSFAEIERIVQKNLGLNE